MSVKLSWGAVKRHGFEMFEARVLDADGRVLHRVVRWSEAGARTEAERWWLRFLRDLSSKP